MTLSPALLDDGPWSLSVSVSADHDRRTLAADLAAVMATAPTRLDGTAAVQVWIEEVRDGDDEAVAHLVTPYRDLWQLRRRLPADPSGLVTRGFDPGRDVQAWVDVNNRAFAWHPEQSGQTPDRVAATMAEPWFDADGFRILEIDGRMAGFCWTKVHADHDPPMGEIFVIGLDPDFHGRGLGGPMTLAGLEWLSAQGITLANLYVESDNDPANATYERLGFSHHATNRAYTSDPAAVPGAA